MTEDEKRAVEILNDRKNRIREVGFQYLRQFRRADEKQLRAAGHKTREAAILWGVEHYLKEIQKLEEAHLAAFPD
jgi:hypothetical protein